MEKELEIAGELSEKILEAIMAYDGKIATISVIGILEIIKLQIYTDAQGN